MFVEKYIKCYNYRRKSNIRIRKM